MGDLRSIKSPLSSLPFFTIVLPSSLLFSRAVSGRKTERLTCPVLSEELDKQAKPLLGGGGGGLCFCEFNCSAGPSRCHRPACRWERECSFSGSSRVILANAADPACRMKIENEDFPSQYSWPFLPNMGKMWCGLSLRFSLMVQFLNKSSK